MIECKCSGVSVSEGEDEDEALRKEGASGPGAINASVRDPG